jgi:YidC/Oxa1 family membrane protein insertase
MMSILFRISFFILIFTQQAYSLDQNISDRITLNPEEPTIKKWTTCYPDCLSNTNIFLELSNDTKPFIEIFDSKGDAYDDYLISSDYEGDDFEVVYTSRNPLEEISNIIYKSDKENRFLELIIQSDDDVKIEIDLKNLLSEEDIYGLGGIYNGTWLVIVDEQGSENISSLRQANTKQASWVGARTRFWSFLISPIKNNLLIDEIDGSESRLRLMSEAGNGLHQFRLYFGPLNTAELSELDPQLRQLMYSALWDWLRQLCFLIEWIFISLLNLVGNEGIAILLLACALKIMIFPLNRIAEKWQDDVNSIRSDLQPQIDEIKSMFSGEEANRRIMQLYQDRNISPFYSVKSLFGFLIQIPIFIAVFDVLGESIYLLEKSFFFIDDLSKPDQWLSLPIVIPFLGSSFNLLPFCMMIISLLSAFLYHDRNLSSDLLSNQKRNLYFMSLLFFILLFTFPSGMVLYWTASNIMQLLQMQIKKALQ